MSKKKSYMNRENILVEGFFDKLFKMFKVSKSDQVKIKKDKKIRGAVKDLNGSVTDLEGLLSKQYGYTVNLGPKYKLSDFI
jgi:hypothetical protein